MQQQPDNSIRQLRSLENESLPDLSQLDEHWKNMQASLATAPQPVAVSHPYRWFFLSGIIGAAGIIGSLFFWNILPPKTNAPQSQLLAKDTVPAKVALTKPVTPSAPADSVTVKRVTAKNRAVRSLPPQTETEAVEPTLAVKDTLHPSQHPQKARKATTVLLKARTSDGRDTVLQATVVGEHAPILLDPVSKPGPARKIHIQAVKQPPVRPDTFHLRAPAKAVRKNVDSLVLYNKVPAPASKN